MRVALIGPPLSGKSTLFEAVARTGGSNVDMSRPDQPHLAVVKVPDERLAWLARKYQPKKLTPAELDFLDLPGFDLSDQAGRTRAKLHWTAMRQSDMLVFVVRSFQGDSAPPYRNRIDAAADVEELLSEMIFADLEQVTNRIEKLEVSVRKPTGHRDEQMRELDLMKRLCDTLESEKPIADAIACDSEAKLIRSFSFLSEKPVLVALNVSEQDAAGSGPAHVHGQPCIQLSAEIENELAQLDEDERGEFLADLGIAAPARDRLIRACYEALDLASFLTYGPDECRAWTVPASCPAVEAAGEIHSDISRGFIRAETVAFEDLRAAGDFKAARAAGKIRLEGKNYPVQDGDVITFRFNV